MRRKPVLFGFCWCFVALVLGWSGDACARSWQIAEIDPDSAAQALDVAFDGSGTPHVVYVNDSLELVYATCTGGCETGDWVRTVLGSSSGESDWVGVALAVGETGTLHIVFDGDFYMECCGGCTAAGNWSAPVQVGIPGSEAYRSDLVIDGNGTLGTTTTYLNPLLDSETHYLHCQDACHEAVNWTTTVTLTAYATLRADMSIAAAGERIGISYIQGQGGVGSLGMKYQYCGTSCDDPANWSGEISIGSVAGCTMYTNLTLNTAGGPRFVYSVVEPAKMGVLSCSDPDCSDSVLLELDDGGAGCDWDGFDLALSETAKPGIVSFHPTFGMKYYECAVPDSGCILASDWMGEVVNGASSFSRPALAFSGEDPAIAYSAGDTVQYALGEPGPDPWGVGKEAVASTFGTQSVRRSNEANGLLMLLPPAVLLMLWFRRQIRAVLK